MNEEEKDDLFMYEFLKLIDRIESDDIKNLKVNGDFEKLCELMKKYGFCQKEKENK